MGLLQKLKSRRAEKQAEREAIERAHEESMRAGEEPEKTEADIIDDALGSAPPPD